MRLMTIRASLALLATFATAGCNGGKDEDSDTEDTEEDTEDTEEDTDTDENAEEGFTIEATAIDLATNAPAETGLCVDLLDPTPAAAGGESILLLSTTVGENGAFVFADVVTDTGFGLLMSVHDCEDAAEASVYPTATGIPLSALPQPGGTLSDQKAFSISLTFLGGMQQSAALLGYTGDLAVDGLLMGFVLDETGTPIAGATVTDEAELTTTYYMDGDSTDGLFSTAAAMNASTQTGVGIFLIPAAPVGYYVADDAGAHDFGDKQINGSNPGIASVTAFFGTSGS